MVNHHKPSINGPFSIAMLNSQRVVLKTAELTASMATTIGPSFGDDDLTNQWDVHGGKPH